jgi:poly-gamma-glutamate capsule biosynthesis protein CapA/YwtB (metallophosphatase superfamily)
MGAADRPGHRTTTRDGSGGPLTLFLAGDVMTGRGIDQVLPRSVDPRLFESYVKTAARYVQLAEAAHGTIPAPVPYEYVWGDALDELTRAAPDVRVVNLETAVTTATTPWPGKGIHYRMHPANTAVLTAAAIDVCVLANNHVMDWGREGLMETLATLRDSGIATTGAGDTLQAALRPAIVETDSGRVLVFGWGLADAGVPGGWEAGAGAGVALLPAAGAAASDHVIAAVDAHRRPGDRVVVSLHWGANWGYDVASAHQSLARRLTASGAVDLVFGHSSHHPKGLEVHAGRLVLYGAGDFLNDYEGIGGRESYRSDLTLMYLPVLAPAGELARLRLVPLRLRRFRLERAPEEAVDWLAETLDRHSRSHGVRVHRTADGLEVSWQ